MLDACENETIRVSDLFAVFDKRTKLPNPNDKR